MTTATQRIEHYLNELNKMSGIDKESIHQLHTGHETREAELTQSDIREVLRENAELREMLREALIDQTAFSILHNAELSQKQNHE